jgi:hypothetical protein
MDHASILDDLDALVVCTQTTLNLNPFQEKMMNNFKINIFKRIETNIERY